MIGGLRYVFAIMLSIANMIIYGLKVNMSLAINAMAPKGGKPIGYSHDPTYDWSEKTQSSILGAYFFGYLIGMFPSGYFANRFNTKWVLIICVFCNGVATLLVPTAAAIHPDVLQGLRFFNGLMSAANLPIVNVMVGKWIVFEEKTLWVAIIYAGTSLGTVLSILSTGWIIEFWGWKAVFYIQGTLPFIWVVLYGIMFSDTPEAQKWITEEEREKIVTSQGHRGPDSGKSSNVPWGAIFTNIPFLALVATNTLGNFTWYFLLTLMPKYMAGILNYTITQNSTLTCLPYLCNVIINPCMGRLLDYGRRKEWWSQTGARKMAVAFSCIPAIIMIGAIPLFMPDRTGRVILMSASIVTSGAIFIGHLINQNDLAPNYAGLLMGITNTPGTISAFLLPWLNGVLNPKGPTNEGWNSLMLITISAQAAGLVVFTIFGKAEIQPFNDM